MTTEQFTSQMSRLSETYGKTHYGTERAKLIWNEVRDLPDFWLTELVSQLIGTERQAPLVDQFRSHAQRFKLREHEKRKRDTLAKEMNELSASDEGPFPPEERAMMFATIQKRIAGGVSDQDWDAFMRMIENAKPRKVMA